jgi:3-oxoacyl-[acyl-carrier-protein] synthase II
MERVVVTGLGLVTPLGVNAEATWSAAVQGRSGAGPITVFPVTEDYPTRFAAEVKGFDPTEYLDKKKLKECCRFIPFALAAARMAAGAAGLALSDEERERAGVFIGAGMGGLEALQEITRTVDAKGPRRVSPYTIPSLLPNMAAGQVSIALGYGGPSVSHTSACASSAHSLGEAMRWIQRGDAEVILAGGAEATIWPIGIAGFSAMHALSRRNDDPERASRPWDRGRDGFVCGEGAGALVLESLGHARRRGARILCELTGYAATSDAYHITKPAPNGRGGIRAMRDALRDARIDASQVDYINAHATSTPAGDIEESRAIATLFGAHALDRHLWVSSTKSMTGHLLGAAGAVEAALCVRAIETGVVPPTINLDDPDPECVLDYVPHQARERRVRHAISNSFGFGGTNVSLVFSALEA